jgi:hypothetical protein
MTVRSLFAAIAAAAVLVPLGAAAAEAVPPRFPPPALHDGAHDFDFLIGNWKAHLKRLPKRLQGSTDWVEYDGISNHHKLLDSNANFEEFDVSGPAGRIKAQTLRLYDPDSKQWSIYGVDVDKGVLGLPATVGEFTDGKGEFYDHEVWDGRMIWVRFQWAPTGRDTVHFEQAFSADGGRTWEVNWILDLTRAK